MIIMIQHTRNDPRPISSIMMFSQTFAMTDVSGSGACHARPV